MRDYLRDMIARRKNGEICGIGSYCTANELVIEACMQRAKEAHEMVLIEATANQVNQFGGYTGMLPSDFRDFVYAIADRIDFPRESILLGGDHLGPLTWQNELEESAMGKAAELVRLFVLSGFKKIHLDTSMRLADDSPDRPLTDETIARRGAALYATCEEAYQELLKRNPEEIRPAFIIGSEVPIPGGAQEAERSIAVTGAEALRKTVDTYRNAFSKAGYTEGFRNVIGIVVQPGVEFGDADFFPYCRENARELITEARKLNGIVLEGHSTDYQPARALREMVEDGIAILKVGPALTFGLREGLFALDMMERFLVPESEQAHFMDTLERVMLEQPGNWKKYYHGDARQLAIKRRFSFSDRSRYYLTNAEVKAATTHLIENLRRADIPLSMLHQYMPLQYYKVRDGRLPLDPRELVKDCVATFVDDYVYATH